MRWRSKTHELGLTCSTARSSGDAYSLDLATGTLTRWTESETGGVRTASFAEPELVHWTSFDGRAIPGFLYKPPRGSPDAGRGTSTSIAGPRGSRLPGSSAPTTSNLASLASPFRIPTTRDPPATA